MPKRWSYATKVTLIALAVIFVPAALLDGWWYLVWADEGVRGPFRLGFLPAALWFLPVVATVAILVTFFSGDVPGSERPDDDGASR
ncbi:hypothetical protein HD599_000965 [Conyzicola lurida]|uniref:Uncharacterized protein n=1 Tax=Conyzicola lurida TaxID=1172621 RepID=A0A841AL03_9MICO|nr:hypothetical protein [Conyzicola lurida]MBB5842642.1 hypothetical protein [Conyzicola lurida]